MMQAERKTYVLNELSYINENSNLTRSVSSFMFPVTLTVSRNFSFFKGIVILRVECAHILTLKLKTNLTG